MNLKDNYLNRDNVVWFFQENFAFPGDSILKIALRYIAIQGCNKDFQQLKPISVQHEIYSMSKSLETYFNEASQREKNIFLFDRSSQASASFLSNGWKELNHEKYPVVQFLSKTSPTSIFINEELKKVIVFVTKLSEKWITEFTSVIFRILIWFFPEGKLDNDEQKFFKAISENNTDVLNELASRVCNLIDFRIERQRREKEKFRKDMHGWGNEIYRTLTLNLEKAIEVSRQAIIRASDTLARLRNELTKQVIQHNALKNAPMTTDDSVFQFFEMQKQLNIINIEKDPAGNNSILYYSINETIEFFDSDEFNTQYKNQKSYLHKSEYSQEIRNLMIGLFAKGKGNLKTRCVFKLTSLSGIEPSRNWPFGDNKVIPHPHIDMHQCLGNNGLPIDEYLSEGNWEQAVLQTIAAAKNIYFGDVGVVSSMMRWLESNKNSKEKLIIADNGNEMDINEFLNFIKETEDNG